MLCQKPLLFRFLRVPGSLCSIKSSFGRGSGWPVTLWLPRPRCVREVRRVWDLGQTGTVGEIPEMAPPSLETTQGLQGSLAIRVLMRRGLGCNSDLLGPRGHHEPGHLHPWVSSSPASLLQICLLPLSFRSVSNQGVEAQEKSDSKILFKCCDSTPMKALGAIKRLRGAQSPKQSFGKHSGNLHHALGSAPPDPPHSLCR